ncbi:MAG: MoaD/ThiS family protein [Chloroflexi bacterium]|nr:MoaD/ThiS family protein [Chloroflexota bacterium]
MSPESPLVAVEVHLPPAVRRTAGHRAVVAAKGATVRQLLDDLERQYPGMRFHVCHETGELRPHVNIFVNSENIRYLQQLDTPLSGGEVVYILHAISGG